MTEALRPRPGLVPDRSGAGQQRPGGAHPGAEPLAAHPAAKPAPRPVTARRTAEARRPYHVGVCLGLSAAVYAVSLAGVTALQSSSERGIAAAQAPSVAALQAVAAGHDVLERRLAGSGAAYDAAAGGYQRAADSLGSLERELEGLSASVAKVTGVTSALPNHVALPSLPRVPVAAAAPAVHATTTASGQPLP